jgi:ParB family chromosome partitioning protein
MWELHDRLETHITEHTCRAEIESFEKHGQLVPVLGRPVKDDSSYDVELIYGARRLFVAQHLNKPILVEVRAMTDMEAIVAMDIENRQRKSISPYEQGLCYAQWLRARYFASQDDIARTLRISSSQVSRLLKIARLPPVVVNAFESPLDIREGWGLDLALAWEDPPRKAALIDRARAVSAMPQRPASAEVFRQLISSAARGRPIPRKAHDEVIKDDLGNALFRIRQQRKTIALLLPATSVSAPTLMEIKRALVRILQDSNQASPASARRAAPSKGSKVIDFGVAAAQQ